MKKVNVTFSLPQDVHKELQSLIGRRKMSMFVAEAVSNALEKKRLALKRAYIEAEADEDRQETLSDWSTLDTEGWE